MFKNVAKFSSMTIARVNLQMLFNGLCNMQLAFGNLQLA